MARTTNPTNASEAPRIPGSLSLVLPVHNEEENIRIVIERALEVLPRFTSDFEIVPVNDGSRDQSGAILAELGAEHPQVKPQTHKVNRGYGAALTTGFQAATSDYVMFMDSDRQFDIADLALLAPLVGRYDIVAGFRMERNDPLHRRIFAEIFNVTVRILFGVHLRDIDCAFKVFRGDLLRSLELTAPGALINTEMQAKLRRSGATLSQVGVHHYPRIAGTATGGNPRVIARAMKETLLLWWRMRSYRPPAIAPNPQRAYSIADSFAGAASMIGLTKVAGAVKRRVNGEK